MLTTYSFIFYKIYKMLEANVLPGSYFSYLKYIFIFSITHFLTHHFVRNVIFFHKIVSIFEMIDR